MHLRDFTATLMFAWLAIQLSANEIHPCIAAAGRATFLFVIERVCFSPVALIFGVAGVAIGLAGSVVRFAA